MTYGVISNTIGGNMADYLSKSTYAEISSFFRKQSYLNKKDLIRYTKKQLEILLQDSDFVYVTETGNVIHSNRHCGSIVGYPVHIEQAIKHGYHTLCQKCATGTRLENVVRRLYDNN